MTVSERLLPRQSYGRVCSGRGKNALSVQEHFEAAIERIRQRLRARGEREVASRLIGEEVMAQLRLLDQVAYTRFASVDRSFQDLDEFRAEIDRLAQDPPFSRGEHLSGKDDTSS